MKQDKLDPYYRKRRWNHRYQPNQNRRYRAPKGYLEQPRDAAHVGGQVAKENRRRKRLRAVADRIVKY